MPEHQHAEAFKLMEYRSDDGLDSEIIWNSRDGVTPFVITLRNGKQASHVNWHSDVYAPNHRPQPGERIFVDLTERRARELAKRNAERYAELYPVMVENQGGVEKVEEILLQSMLDKPGAPDLIEVIP